MKSKVYKITKSNFHYEKVTLKKLNLEKKASLFPYKKETLSEQYEKEDLKNSILLNIKKFYKNKDYHSVKKYLKLPFLNEILESSCDEFFYYLGLIFFQEKDYIKANYFFKKILKNKKNKIKDIYKHTKILFIYLCALKNDTKEAEEMILNLLKQKNNSIIELSLLGYFFFIKRMYKKSFKYYDEVLKKNSNNANAHNMLGYIYLFDKSMYDVEKALEHYKKANELDSNSVSYLDSLALAYRSKKDYKKAIAYIKTALEKEPLNFQLKSHLEEILTFNPKDI